MVFQLIFLLSVPSATRAFLPRGGRQAKGTRRSYAQYAMQIKRFATVVKAGILAVSVNPGQTSSTHHRPQPHQPLIMLMGTAVERAMTLRTRLQARSSPITSARWDP